MTFDVIVFDSRGHPHDVLMSRLLDEVKAYVARTLRACRVELHPHSADPVVSYVVVPYNGRRTMRKVVL